MFTQITPDIAHAVLDIIQSVKDYFMKKRLRNVVKEPVQYRILPADDPKTLLLAETNQRHIPIEIENGICKGIVIGIRLNTLTVEGDGSKLLFEYDMIDVRNGKKELSSSEKSYLDVLARAMVFDLIRESCERTISEQNETSDIEDAGEIDISE